MGDSLRIALFVHHQLTAGTGAAGSTLTLAEALRVRGHEVDVFGLEIVGPGESLSRQLRFPLVAAQRVRQALRNNEYDVIDASTGDLWLLTRAEIARSRTVVATRSHGLEPLGVAARRDGARRGEMTLRRRYGLYHGGWRLHEVRRTLQIADAVLVLNRLEKAYVTSLRRDASSTVVTAPLMGAGYASTPDATSEPRVLVVGGTQWRKGGFDNAAIIVELLKRHPEVHVTWLGVGVDEVARYVPETVRRRVRALTSFATDEASSLLAGHRVVVHLSRFEGWGMLAVEALSHGCLVVGTDAGVVGEAIASSGFVVPFGDRPATLSAIEAALGASDMAQRSARAAEAARRFEPSRVVAVLEENYREAIRAKSARRSGTGGGES